MTEKNTKFTSIRTKLIWSFILIIVLPISVIGIMISYNMENIIYENFINSTKCEMEKADNYVNMYFENIKRSCELLANTIAVKNIDESISTYYDKTSSSGWVKQTPFEKMSKVEKEIVKTYESFGKIHPNYSYFFQGTIYGGFTQWPHAPKVISGYDPRKRPWYVTNINLQENKFSVRSYRPIFDGFMGNPVFNVSNPIINDKGEIIGVQCIDVRGEELTNLVSKISIGRQGYIIITDKYGKILLHPKKPELNLTYFNNIEGLPQKESGYYEVSLDENNKDQKSLVNIYTSKELGWKYLAVVDKNEVMANVNQVRSTLFSLILIFVFISVSLSSIFTRKFSHSIINAGQFAKEIAAGNLDVKYLIHPSTDELGLLINALNDMRDNLILMVKEITGMARQFIQQDHSDNLDGFKETQPNARNDSPDKSNNKLFLSDNQQKLKGGVLLDALLALKEAGEVLKESEEKYRILIEHSPFAVEVICEGKYAYANPATAKMLGLKNPEELIGKKVATFNLEENHYQFLERKIFQRVINKGQTIEHYESKLLRADNTIIHIEVSAIPYRHQGKPAILYIWRDITERKKMEEEWARSCKLESMGLFAGGIAHDYNNILTVIQGNVSLIELYAKENEKILAFLSEIKIAVNQSKTLTHQLLTFSKGGEPIKKVVQIEEVVRETVNLGLTGSNVKCLFDFKKMLPVEMDEGQIRQVIHNLVINAIQAMPDGGTIWAKGENVDIEQEPAHKRLLSPGKYVKISIKDEGMGIPQKYLTKIFDPFFTTKKFGSGIGLATCYSIVKKHNGHISVESKLEVGTTFYIYLPISIKPVKEKEKNHSPVIYGKGNILVMDDEANIRDVAGKMLLELGYSVELAKNGQETLELYQIAQTLGRKFDAVILDLTIPGGLGGKEIIKTLKKLDPEVTAIVSSGYSTDPVMANYAKYGFQGMIVKPYELGNLSEVVNDVLTKKENMII